MNHALRGAELVRDLERTRLLALVERDIKTADSLHADDYQLVTPGGATLSKREYIGGIVTGDLRYVVFEPATDIDVRWYGNAAAIRYRARIEVSFAGQADSADAWHTDIYERRPDGWQVVWSQATRITRRGDPV